MCHFFSLKQCSQIKNPSTENHEDFENFAEFGQINFENFVVLPLKNFDEIILYAQQHDVCGLPNQLMLL